MLVTEVETSLSKSQRGFNHFITEGRAAFPSAISSLTALPSPDATSRSTIREAHQSCPNVHKSKIKHGFVLFCFLSLNGI